MGDKAVNAGVTALTGFALQRNCALFLLLEDYNFYKDRDFFLCIEHKDDFLFAFTTKDYQTLLEVNAYQSKKKSGGIWKIDAKFVEIIVKILEVGSSILDDAIPKSKDYSHILTFISNTHMSLEYAPTKKLKSQGEKPSAVRINEQNEKQSFRTFPKDVKDKLDGEIQKHCKKRFLNANFSELNNLNMQWVDFATTANKQKEALIGLMHAKFSHVVDPKASIDLFIELFNQIEQTYNQKSIASLLDESKRLYGHDLKKTLDIIQTEQKTYDKWRKKADIWSKEFRIPILIQNQAEDKIRETFEYFKDLRNLEHLKIKKFVAEHDYRHHYDELDMFKDYIENIKAYLSINLNDVDIFFVCLCAYVEHYDEGSL